MSVRVSYEYELLSSLVYSPLPARRRARLDLNLFNFPAGEVHAALPEDSVQPVPDSAHTFLFEVDSADSDTLFQLAMALDLVDRTYRPETCVLALPYLPGARMDRGEPLGAKVYADFINALDFDAVVCLDPHSDVAPALYDRLIRMPVEDLSFWKRTSPNWAGVIAPDYGAVKRAEAVAKRLGGLPVYQGHKKRDFATGKLSGFSIDLEGKRFGFHDTLLVVDDICDGGGTFVGLADCLKAQHVVADLWVTHGVFSKGLDTLMNKYVRVLTTDSLFSAKINQPSVASLDKFYHVEPVFDQLFNYWRNH